MVERLEDIYEDESMFEDEYEQLRAALSAALLYIANDGTTNDQQG
jgi:hypothetical protein